MDTKNPDEYQGCANRETWAFMLNVNNEQDVQNLAHREVRRCIANGYHPNATGEHVVTWFRDCLFDVIEDGWATGDCSQQSNLRRLLRESAADAYRILLEVGSWWRIDTAEIGAHFVADVLDIDSVAS